MVDVHQQKIQVFGTKGTAYLLLAVTLWVSACSTAHRIERQAQRWLYNDSAISTGHIGISIYHPATHQYYYNHEATKLYVPGSTVKLFTLYAGMKYLGDSLIGLRYQQQDSALLIHPTGDPSFLHPDFKAQRVFDFLNKQRNIQFASTQYQEGLGQGWAWDDYLDNFMVQRSEFPIYGNLINISISKDGVSTIPKNLPLTIQNKLERSNNKVDYQLSRDWNSNALTLTTTTSASEKEKYRVPLVPNNIIGFLSDTLHQNIAVANGQKAIKQRAAALHVIHSQPSDSLFKPMMHRSDNFFAEQTLLMVSNEKLGYMKDADIIDSLLNTDLKDIPQKPRWVDGSGLSRYNLFSPQSMIYIVEKTKNEFGLKRLQSILPTGGQGTLKNYYLNDSTAIYAKTGSMGNQFAISGWLLSAKGEWLIFSVMTNSFQGSTTPVRRAVERFLESVRARF